jgi:GNAT superfamily N-acetyltransferase
MRLVSCMRRYAGINILRVLQRDLGGAARVPCTRRNIECRVLSEHELVAFALDPQLELDHAWVRNAYASGGVCLGALEDRRLLGYTWLAFRDTPYTRGVWIGFDSKFRYSYKSFVRPQYRGQRIAQALHALADEPELRRGRCLAVNVIDVDNLASRAALERAGSRTIGYAAYAKCFGVLIALRSPALRRAGISFYRPTRARIRMRAWPTPTAGT